MTSRPGPLGQLLATELRAELGRQNKSRRWLADQINAPHNTVARWVGGETTPPLDSLNDMCDALGINLAALISAAKEQMRGGRARSGGIPFARRASDLYAVAG